MITCKCIKKFRDNTGKIYGYRIIDINGETQDVTPGDLKKAIYNKQVNVVNLTLTKDGRLVDKNPEKQLKNKKIMPNNVIRPIHNKEKFIDDSERKVIEQLLKIQDYAVKKLGIKQGKKFKWTTSDDGVSIDKYVNIHFKSGEFIGDIVNNNTLDTILRTIDTRKNNGDTIDWINCILIDFGTDGDCYIFLKWEAITNKYLFYEGRGVNSNPFNVEYKEATDMFHLTNMRYDTPFTYEEIMEHINNLSKQ